MNNVKEGVYDVFITYLLAYLLHGTESFWEANRF